MDTIQLKVLLSSSDEGKGMRDTRAREAAALARLNQSYGFLLNNGVTEGMRLFHVSNLLFVAKCGCININRVKPL